ncbi:MAG: hypothetical protein J3R72DRAFT_500952, partial [Linnemannia gamsii]
LSSSSSSFKYSSLSLLSLYLSPLSLVFLLLSFFPSLSSLLLRLPRLLNLLSPPSFFYPPFLSLYFRPFVIIGDFTITSSFHFVLSYLSFTFTFTLPHTHTHTHTHTHIHTYTDKMPSAAAPMECSSAGLERLFLSPVNTQMIEFVADYAGKIIDSIQPPL